jgi:hypothetical protein
MTPKAIANGNPRCWHCLNRLVYKKGGGFKFDLVVDPLGAEHRVHHHCVDDVIGDGVKRVPKPSIPA